MKVTQISRERERKTEWESDTEMERETDGDGRERVQEIRPSYEGGVGGRERY